MHVLAILALATMMSCSKSDELLHDKIIAAVKPVDFLAPGRYKLISLDSLTDFEWDTLYVFGGETRSGNISRKIGFKWNGSNVPNLHSRLLFTNGVEVVAYVDFNNETFPIDLKWCDESFQSYSHNRAKFVTFKYCDGRNRVYYPMVPIDCYKSGNFYKQMVDVGCTP